MAVAETGTEWLGGIIDLVKKVPDYQLKEGDILSENGLEIICSECHEVKRVKKETEIFGPYWSRPETGGCACERKAAEEKRKLNEKEEYLSFWNSERYQRLMGKRYIGKTFERLTKVDNESYEMVRDKCEKYAQAIDISLKKGYGLYIFSAQSGNGKTTLLACIRNALVEKLIPVVFIGYNNLIEMAKSGELEGVSYKGVKEVPVLIIDDIGSEDLRRNEARGEWVNGILEKLIDYRHDNLLCTLFSSNYSIKQLQSIRGYRAKTVDRIVELSTKVYEIQGDSFRGQEWEMKA